MRTIASRAALQETPDYFTQPLPDVRRENPVKLLRARRDPVVLLQEAHENAMQNLARENRWEEDLDESGVNVSKETARADFNGAMVIEIRWSG